MSHTHPTGLFTVLEHQDQEKFYVIQERRILKHQSCKRVDRAVL